MSDDTHAGRTRTFRLPSDVQIYVTAAISPDGERLDAFELVLDRIGSDVRACAELCERLIRLASRHGATLDEIAGELVATRCEPSGIVPGFGSVLSPFDAAGRWLRQEAERVRQKTSAEPAATTAGEKGA